jgi:hypothetical protein
MKHRTQTLEVNSPALEFTLPAANRPQHFSLRDLVSSGTLVLEFLRGTW